MQIKQNSKIKYLGCMLDETMFLSKLMANALII